jgi:hypothetical protein
MIRKKIRALWGVCIAGLTVLGGCFNGLEGPQEAERAKEGMVTISIGEDARTLMPDVRQFDELELTITPAAGGEAVYQEPIVGGQATVYLGEGAWNLRVDGYVNNNLRATATNTLTNTAGEITGNTRFSLTPVGTGTGTLKYTITKPGALEAGSELVLSRADGGALSLEGFEEGVLSLNDSKTGTVDLDPGRYKAEVVLKGPEGTYAATVETVVILPGLETELVFAPAAFGDPGFLAPLSFGTTTSNSSNTRIGAAGGTGTARTQAIVAYGAQDEVYFTLAKTPAQTVSVEGNPDFVSKATTAVDGTTPGAALEVFTVDTRDIRLGGYREFTLEVAETGKSPITIGVTVSHGGFGLFIDEGDEETGENLVRVESSEEFPIEDLKTALAYLRVNATEGETYVIYLDKDEAIPIWEGVTVGNVTLRLKGIGGPRTVSWDPNAPIDYNSRGGLFTLDYGSTLELDHIILDGKHRAILLNHPLILMGNTGSLNAVLILKEGTKIINFVSSRSPNTIALGAVIGGSTGTVIMEGGEISGNRTGQMLIAVDRFEMSGGSIRNNNSIFEGANPNVASGSSAANRPAAVYATYFVMTGGEIRDNGRSGVMCGVGVLLEGEMSGGTIEGNGTYKTLIGGGVTLAISAKFTMSGGTIRNNSSPEILGNGIAAMRHAGSAPPYGIILQNTLTLEDRIVLTGTGAGASTARNTTVTVGEGFTNTACPITVDIYAYSGTDSAVSNSENVVINRPYIVVTKEELSVEEALKSYFTFGDYAKGNIVGTSTTVGGLHADSRAFTQGPITDFFTVDPETGILTVKPAEEPEE